MKVGYARTSTTDQLYGLEAQVEELTKTGCERVFTEQVSSVGHRHVLIKALEFVRDGDSLVVTKLDRLARSTQHLLEVTANLKRKGVGLVILNLGMDTSTATGQLMMTMLGAIGEFERTMMLERQREGIQRARHAGKYTGRAPTVQRQAEQVLALLRAGVSAGDVAKQLQIGRSSVYRVLRNAAAMSSCNASA